jgi:peptidoglycan/xylan/chitin deacetylase (PgdA/CDA1 family)
MKDDIFEKIRNEIERHPIEVRASIFLILIFCILIGIFYFFKIDLNLIKFNKNKGNNSPQINIVSSEEIDIGRKDKNQVIFSFDGGSGTESVDKVLEVLKKHNIRSSFFLTGEWVNRNPSLVFRIHNNGHEIFNHTYNHPHLTEVSDEVVKKELNDMDKILFMAIGIHSGPYFRPPYGDRDERVRKVAAKNGYRTVYWTFDAMDWEESLGRTAENVYDGIILNLKPGEIYLMHLGDSITGEILDRVLTEIEIRKYKIVPLTEGI